MPALEPFTETIHGVALLVGEAGLLIRGRSGAGKSRLAARMLAHWPDGPVRLIADDRVRITRRNGRLIAETHPAIFGRMELRGLGLVAAVAKLRPSCAELWTFCHHLSRGLPEETALRSELAGIILPRLVVPEAPESIESLLAFWPHFRLRMSADG